MKYEEHSLIAHTNIGCRWRYRPNIWNPVPLDTSACRDVTTCTQLRMCIQFDAVSIGFSVTAKPVLSGYSKTDKNDLMTNCSLMKVESIAEYSPQFNGNRSWKSILVFLLSDRLRQVLQYLIWFLRKMQLIVFSCVPRGLILAFWNALKRFSATLLHPLPHTGRGTLRPLQECVLYKMS